MGGGGGGGRGHDSETNPKTARQGAKSSGLGRMGRKEVVCRRVTVSRSVGHWGTGSDGKEGSGLQTGDS